MYANLARALRGAGQQANAVEAYKSALAIEPTRRKALLNLLQSLSAMNQPVSALRIYGKLKAEGGDLKLQTSGRFAHSSDYVKRCARQVGLNLLHHEDIPLRKDRGQWLSGGLFVFTLGAAPPDKE